MKWASDSGPLMPSAPTCWPANIRRSLPCCDSEGCHQKRSPDSGCLLGWIVPYPKSLILISTLTVVKGSASLTTSNMLNRFL